MRAGRPRPRVRAAVPALVVLALAGLVGCSDDDSDTGSTDAEAAGTVVALRDGAVTGTVATVQLPDRHLRVGLDPDLGATLAGADSTDRVDHTAADGLRWVGLAWDDAVGEGVPSWAQPLVVGGDAAPPVLRASLVVGDDDVALPAPVASLAGPDDAGDASPSTLAVAVPAGADARLEVDLDGVVQVVDLATGDVDPGEAAGLSALPAEQPPGTSCGEQATLAPADGASVRVPVECLASVTGLPWVAGLGWAEDPSAGWAVLNASLGLPEQLDVGAGTYDVTSVVGTTTLGGQQPSLRVLDDASATGLSLLAVYPGPVDAAPEVSADLTLTRDTGTGPQQLTGRLSVG